MKTRPHEKEANNQDKIINWIFGGVLMKIFDFWFQIEAKDHRQATYCAKWNKDKLRKTGSVIIVFFFIFHNLQHASAIYQPFPCYVFDYILGKTAE